MLYRRCRDNQAGLTVLETTLAVGIFAVLATVLVTTFAPYILTSSTQFVANQVKEIERGAWEFRRDRARNTAAGVLDVWPSSIQDLVTGGYIGQQLTEGPRGGTMTLQSVPRGYDIATGPRSDDALEIGIPTENLGRDELLEISQSLGAWRVRLATVGGIQYLVYRATLQARTREYGATYSRNEYLNIEDPRLTGPQEMGGYGITNLTSVGAIGGFEADPDALVQLIRVSELELPSTSEPTIFSFPSYIGWPASPGGGSRLAESYTSFIDPTFTTTILNMREEKYYPFRDVSFDNEIWVTPDGWIAVNNVSYLSYTDYRDYVRSDERLKEDITPLIDNQSATTVKQTSALSYTLRTEPGLQLGLDVRDVEEFPGVTAMMGGYGAIDYSRVPAILWSAARDQMQDLITARELRQQMEEAVVTAESDLRSEIAALSSEDIDQLRREGIDIDGLLEPPPTP